MIEKQTDTRNETLRHIAALMMNAARTAPKARGVDNLEIAMITGTDIDRLADKLEEMSSQPGRAFFTRDAGNLRQAGAVVLIGSRYEALGLNCGWCGFATCADKGLLYLKGEAKVNGIRWAADAKKAAAASSGAVKVTVNGKAYEVVFDGDSAVVNGKRYNVSTAASDAKAEAKPAANTGAGGTVKSPLPGAVLRLSAKDGEHVSEGQEIMVLEAMKMETAVSATASGTVHFLVKQGDQVQTGDALAEIK